jgi:hypothetical protein
LLLGVGLVLLSTHRALKFLAMLGVGTPELYLREVSGALILAGLGALAAGKYSVIALPFSAAWSDLLSMVEVVAWVIVWARRDAHAIFAVLFIAFDILESAARVLPGEALLLLAPLSLVLQLSVLPLWKKLSLKVATLKLLEQP